MPAPTIIHFSHIQEPDTSTYPNDTELLTIGAPFARALGLHHLAIHHEVLPPGRRSSYPHAHESEDEFVYVIEGAPDLWLDGVLHRLRPGDGVGFPAGTGQAHCLLNNTDAPAVLLVVGEPARVHARIHYPLHPVSNEGAQAAGRHWVDERPQPLLGPHDGRPDAPKS